MRSCVLNLAYAETLLACLAIEHGDECLNNPRWIEEDWSDERSNDLQHARNNFEHNPESFSHEQRVAISKRIIHGQTCQHHSRLYAKRLHTLQMIRGDAISDLREIPFTRVRSGRVRTAAARGAKRKAVPVAISLTPEQGRSGHHGFPDEFDSRSSLATGEWTPLKRAWNSC